MTLYQSSKSNISAHIKHIFEEHELDENSVVRNFRTTAKDGKHYNVKYYNLKMIIAIGYRVRSNIGTNFRKWATSTLNEYIVKGFAINNYLLKRVVVEDTLKNYLHELEILDQVKEFFGDKFLIYLQHQLTMILNLKYHKSFLKLYKTKCIGQLMVILLLK